MPKLNFATTYIVLDVITVFMLIFFALFMVLQTGGGKFRQRLLAAFFVVLALSYMDGVFISLSYYFHFTYPYMVHLTMSFDYLVGPVLYIFVLSMTREKFIPRAVHLWHGLPFAIHVIFFVNNYIGYQAAVAASQVQPGNVFTWAEVLVLTSTSSLHQFTYLTLVIVVLNKYRHKIKNNYSSLTEHSLSWLTLISTGLFFAATMRLLNNLSWLFSPNSKFHSIIDLKVFAIVGVFLFACTVVFRTMKQPRFLEHNKQEKYKSARLTDETKQAMLAQIQQYMKERAPYLDPSFDLKTLADGVSLPPHHVSQVLNTELGSNFFDFVNGYRIRESQRLLSEKQEKAKNITQVMYEVGFNSKSVFNSSFKKFTGLTPSQFKKSVV